MTEALSVGTKRVHTGAFIEMRLSMYCETWTGRLHSDPVELRTMTDEDEDSTGFEVTFVQE